MVNYNATEVRGELVGQDSGGGDVFPTSSGDFVTHTNGDQSGFYDSSSWYDGF